MMKLSSVLLAALFAIAASNFAIAQNVGVTPNTGGSPYATLQDAFNAINSGTNGHGLTPTITFLTDYNETVGSTLSGSANFNSVTITASGTRSITCSANAPLITFNNVDNSTADGTLGGGNLTITCTNAGTSIGGFNFSNGSSGNLIRNLSVTATSLNGRLINVAQSTVNGAGNNNNTVEFCTLTGGSRSLQTFGTALAGGIGSRNINTIFRNNTCINAATLAIFLGSETEDVTCDNNLIDFTVSISHAALTNGRGINCQSIGVCNIRNNTIKSFKSAISTSTFIGIISIPQASTNPEPNNLPPPTTITYANNFIDQTSGNLTDASFLYGIAPLSNATTVAYTANVYNNTCRIGGTQVAAGYTVGLAIDVEVAGSTVNSYNNIGYNTRTGGASGTYHIGYDLTAYPFAGVTLNSDYNLGQGSDVANGWDAGYRGTVYKGGFLSQYKDSTCADLVETHTSNDILSFNAGTYTYQAGTVGGNMNGKPGMVSTDILGNSRNASYPYKGCYEGAALKVLTLTICLEEKVNNGEAQIWLFSGAGCTAEAQSFGDVDVNTNTANYAYGDAISNGTPYQLSVVTKNHLETFSASAVTFTSGAASYNFPVSGAFGGNISSGGCILTGDINQDSIIDGSDMINIYNDVPLILTGCRLQSDANSDEIVDAGDLLVTYNNIPFVWFVSSPCPEPTTVTFGTEPKSVSKKVNRVQTDSRLNTYIDNK